MKQTTESLRHLADFPSHKEIALILEAAAQSLEDQRHWRHAWIRAEMRVEELTSELELLRSMLQHRKEKD